MRVDHEKKRDGVRVHHKRKSDVVKDDHGKDQWGKSSPLLRAKG